jgi:hypothetical protein
MAMLIIRKGYNEGAVFRLGQRTLTIGRDVGNPVQIIDDKVSRRHALIRWAGNGYSLQDLNSSNGVFVNGAQVSQATIDVGDRLTIGNTELEVIHDQANVQDQALGRKIADRGIVGSETRAVDISMRTAVSDGLDGLSIDLDKNEEQRDLNRTMFLFELDRLTTRKDNPKAVYDKALAGLAEYLAPDRAFVLQITPDGKALPVSTSYVAGLSAERRRARPAVTAISAVYKRGKPIILNSLPREAGVTDPLGSVAVVPVMGSAGALAALLYLDSFADNHQAFIEEDLELLKNVATRIGKTY